MQFSGLASPNGMSLANVIGGDEASLRQFLATFFGRNYGLTTNETTVTIGQLPDDTVLSALPLPDNISVIGSVQRSQHDSHELLFVADNPDDSFKTQLVENLKANGWRDMPKSSMHPMGGFTAQSSFITLLCHAEKQLRLNISIEDNGLCNINIHKQRKPCEDPHQVHMGMMTSLPQLQPPADGITQFTQGSSGSSDNHANTSASIRTTVSLTELDTHYRQQLINHNWELSQHTVLDDIAISHWHVQQDDETWRAKLIITVIENSDEAELWLELRAPL